MVGKIIPERDLYMKQPAGEGEFDGKQYTMTTIIPGGCPHIRSHATGKRWTVGWDALLLFAIEAGIDLEDASK